MYKLFISYSHSDKEITKKIYDNLIKFYEITEEDIFLDSERLKTGYQYNDEIREAINSSYSAVIIVSSSSADSNYVFKEIFPIWSLFEGADEEDQLNHIFPIIIDNYNPKNVPPSQKTSAGIIRKIWDKNHFPGLVDKDSSYNGDMPIKTSDFCRDIADILNIQKKKEYYNTLFDFKSDIKEGRFVPYLGPLCFGLKEDWEWEKSKLVQRLVKIRELMGDNKELLELDFKYIKAVLESRIDGISKEVEALIGKRTEKETDSVIDAGYDRYLFPLSAAVAKAGAAAYRILGISLNSEQTLLDLRKLQVGYDQDATDDSILRNALCEAKKCAERYSTEYLYDCSYTQDKQVCLGVSGIKVKIDNLYDQIFQTRDHVVHLSLEQLDWLGDLLWHLIKYDLAVLPNNDELAFQFSLCWASSCLTRVPLGTAGVLSETNRLLDGETRHISDDNIKSVTWCTDHIYGRIYNKIEHQDPSAFYSAIATMLQQGNAVMPDGDTDSDVGDLVVQPFWPVAITVNMDTELERSLSGGEFSVIYPMIESNTNSPVWVMRVHSPGKENVFHMIPRDGSFSETFYYKITKTDGTQKSLCYIKGPLIVKLRGSSLHSVPPEHHRIKWLGDFGKLNKQGLFINRVILSSVEYTNEYTVPGLGEPESILDLLRQQGRRLCFFGFPLEDPDSMFSVRRNIWRMELGKDQDEKKGNKFAVECDRSDGFGRAILRQLDVKPLNDKLSDVSNSVKRMFPSEKKKSL